ncbi:carboxymuconolactone decarboxylase family protein [Mesorhizobium sp. M4A.F.Ca.ET.020.02.1.1]|uniref:carboxymuconolactone decarboxylase family protein n=1 Tax=unclassified Mesorhizobium TaxID=325217 RepID=UPI000FD3FB25|nr:MULTISPECIES: carboxymuconolactone decarboxylase family protein [unclassified Mesorhizobium]RVD33919.1 carboxymuconolactone decarboxylase family protein [Mesorhizobium sp. M4A.F.Ca.ET.020.02.1.1]RWC12226.1 MAG: carboxymuconolactone decarboxylase family protein [Mesorhizobium sp.]
MARIDPLSASDAPRLADVISAIQADHGYVPNSFLTLARDPALLGAMGKCADALWYPDDIEQPVRRLVGFAFSLFSGAMYSAAHLACGAEELGLAKDKLLAVRDFETSDVYDARERALLRLCRNAARMPGESRDADVADLREHFSEVAIVVIAGLIAWHAFLNRWNDIMATTLEDAPRRYAEKNLAATGWILGVHG